MISDHELWACANYVLNHHGPDVDRFIAERMSALAAAGDHAGTQAWSAIAERVDRLRQMPPPQQFRH
jgi:hypothetical protein